MSIFSRKRKNGLNEDLPFTISEETISYLMPAETKTELREEQVIDEKSFDVAFMAALGFTDGNVTFEQALQIPAVAASIDFISSICARVPVKLYEENGSDTNELTDDGRVFLLNGDTGDLLNAYQMKKAWVRDYFDGRGYIYINQRRNRVESLHYVEKAQISVSRYTNPIFKDADIHVAGSRYYPWEFLRLCRNTKDCVTGESITDSSSLILSLYYETMKFERRLMNKGGNKKGFLTSEKKIGDEALSKMRETWHNVFDTNSESMMVLNSGIKFQEASATSTELQLNENKETNSNDILLLFLLSAKALQGASDDEIVSAVKTACIPIIEQMEAAYNSGLLLESEKKTKYFSCDTSKLERGDILKRYQAYEIALKSHFMQPDEVRYEEDKKPLGLNWIELGLDSVLFNPETKEIYTPNTNQSAVMEQRDKDDYIQDPETGRMQGREPSETGENDLTEGSEIC
jgi:HK97 family phage portal protein